MLNHPADLHILIFLIHAPPPPPKFDTLDTILDMGVSLDLHIFSHLHFLECQIVFDGWHWPSFLLRVPKRNRVKHFVLELLAQLSNQSMFVLLQLIFVLFSPGSQLIGFCRSD